MKRFLAMAAAVFAASAALSLSTLAASPAQAAGCIGGSCTGLDPSSTGCTAGAVTLSEASGNLTRVELRYSPSCRATWTRWTVIRSHSIYEGVYVYRYNFSGQLDGSRTTNTGTSRGESGWTPMLGVPHAGGNFYSCIYTGECTPAWTAYPW